jgi:mRNA interferase MazF
VIRRGDVFFARIESGIGSEQHGYRPVVVIQNDLGNLHSPTTIVAMITSKEKSRLPTHVSLRNNQIGLLDQSVVMLEQVQTLDKSRFVKPIGHLSNEIMRKIDQSIACSFGLNEE